MNKIDMSNVVGERGPLLATLSKELCIVKIKSYSIKLEKRTTFLYNDII